MRSLIACILPALVLFAPAASAQKPATSATQFYMDYRTAWGKATSIEALLPYLSKDGRADIEATPKDKRQMMFDMMKMMGGGRQRGPMGKMAQMFGLGGGAPQPTPEQMARLQKHMGGSLNLPEKLPPGLFEAPREARLPGLGGSPANFSPWQKKK